MAQGLKEKHFQQQVIELATLCGWLHFHEYDSRMSSPGYPDLFLMHPVKHRFLVRELKAEKGRLRPEQVLWLNGLKACGIDAGVWRPHQWDEIVTTLQS